MEKEVIRLKEIKSRKVVELIKSFVKDSMKFQVVINFRLDKVELKKYCTIIKKNNENYTSKVRYDVYICVPYIEDDLGFTDYFLANEPYWPIYAINFRISILELEDKDEVRALKNGVYVTSNCHDKVIYKEEHLPILSLDNIYNVIKIINSEYEKWQEKQKINSIISSIEITEEQLNTFII